MDLDKLRELAVAHLPVPVETAQIAHETYCHRIGGPVELYDGTCPECGWRYRLSTHSAVSVHPEDLHAFIEEVDRLRSRLRETAQILITEVGASGPMDAEDAARRAVERMTLLRTLADEKAHEAGVYARRMEEAQARSRRDKLSDRLDQVARVVEIAKVVAWLRRNPGISRGPDCITALTLFEAADAIERGDYLKKEKP